MQQYNGDLGDANAFERVENNYYKPSRADNISAFKGPVFSGYRDITKNVKDELLHLIFSHR